MKRSTILIILFSFDFYSNTQAHLDTQWWRHTLIYQLIPFSFKDSDGDGIGDIKGITSKLDYLAEIGIKAIQLTPIHTTTFRDMGYDISDYNAIDPRFGTMEDFHELIKEMEKRDMKLLLDLVINHSGHEHEWFQKSIDRIDPYTDFYVWKDSKGYDNETRKHIPPNNWISVFDGAPGSAWKWNEKRKQFYLHQFLEEQVDFNLSNEFLKIELKKMLKFWLDKGVAGFRIDAVIFFFEDKDFKDDWFDRQTEQPETIEFVHEMRVFLDEYNEKHGGFERIFIAEAHTSPNVVRQFYDQGDYHITHFPYTFELEYINGDIDAIDFNTRIDTRWMQKLPKHAVSTWAMHDHDVSRVGSRTRPEYMDIFTIVSMILPGSVVCYYGQEIGMVNGYVRSDQIADHSENGSRDPHRLLMQWDDTVNAGFSTSTWTILPANTDYFSKNVEIQKKQENSHYSLFKDLSELRKTEILKHGDYTSLAPSKFIYILTRSYRDRAFIVIVNFDVLPSIVDLDALLPMIPNTVSVVAASTNAGYMKGYTLDKSSRRELIMNPVSCIVFEVYNS